MLNFLYKIANSMFSYQSNFGSDNSNSVIMLHCQTQIDNSKQNTSIILFRVLLVIT